MVVTDKFDQDQWDLTTTQGRLVKYHYIALQFWSLAKLSAVYRVFKWPIIYSRSNNDRICSFIKGSSYERLRYSLLFNHFSISSRPLFVIDVNLLWLSEFLEKTHDNYFYFIQIRICHFPVVLAFLKFSFLCKKVDNKITTPLWHCCISHIQ